MNKRRRYDKMSAEEIEADAKVQAWEKATSLGQQLVILGRTPYIVLESLNNVPYAFRVACCDGKETQSFPFRVPNRLQGQGGSHA